MNVLELLQSEEIKNTHVMLKKYEFSSNVIDDIANQEFEDYKTSLPYVKYFGPNAAVFLTKNQFNILQDLLRNGQMVADYVGIVCLGPYSNKDLTTLNRGPNVAVFSENTIYHDDKDYEIIWNAKATISFSYDCDLAVWDEDTQEIQIYQPICRNDYLIELQEKRIVTQDILTDMSEKHELWLEGSKKGKRADFSNCNLRNLDLSGKNLQKAIFINADLRYANLNNANLEFANLEFAKISKADLTKANLSHANLSSSNLWNSCLQGSNLYSARLENTNLTGATLDGALLNYTNFENANLREASFKNVVCEHTKFRRANFEFVDFKNADFREVYSIDWSNFPFTYRENSTIKLTNEQIKTAMEQLQSQINSMQSIFQNNMTQENEDINFSQSGR